MSQLESTHKHFPKVTIGMPVRNGKSFIRKALDSLISQTFTDFELIVSDNASIDATEDICREYASNDRRIVYIRQCANIGALNNFRFVLEKAHSSQYFMWAAADDEWHPYFIESCVHALENNQDHGLAFCRFEAKGRLTGNFLRQRNFPDFSFFGSNDALERVSLFILLDHLSSQKANFIYGVWHISFLKDIMNVISSIDERYVYKGLDIAILSVAAAKRKIFQVPEYLFTKTSNLPATSYLWRLRHMLPFYTDKYFLPSRFAKRRERIICSINEHLWLLEFTMKEAGLPKEFIKQCIDQKRMQMLTFVSSPNL